MQNSFTAWRLHNSTNLTVCCQPRLVFELASGSGQHIVHWAKAFPSAQFQPSEIDDPLLHASIRSYIGEHPNVLPPLTLNAASDADWNRAHSLVRETGAFDMVYVGNVLHIAPWEVTVGLAKNVSKLLAKPRGLFVVYGPFKRDGAFTTSSNEEFDRNLRQRNGDWGLRDISDVANEFAKHNLSLQDIKDMPANNFILVFANTQ
ncbi:hypothetical protein DFJ77DRAFT_45023 [Powellomyces hirtus]|nr:hypothetical protein DFJ77DRAFT_45023 [Powellomyces hirtus]